MSASRRSALPFAVAAACLVGAGLVGGALLSGCQPEASATPAPKTPQAIAAAAAASAPALLVAPEDLRTIGLQAHASGPVITGSIQPERKADLHAEIAAVVMQVYRENGEAVHKGDLLVRLDDTSIRDSLRSAEESSRAAVQAFDQAQRSYERIKTLQAQGMSSMQALDDAEVRRNGAQSDRVAADARAVAARQQLARTEIRAPFDGVVSDRKVSAGDTAAIGKELVKVIDPTSMRFEGLIAADRLGEIAVGQAVMFHVNGYERQVFDGKVRHVDASADDVTRQVAVIVDFAPGTAPRTANLYAEGRVATGESRALMLPEESVAREGDKAFVWRLQGGHVQKTPVRLGDRDARRGEVVIADGLAQGDQVLRTPGQTLVDGQRVELARPAAALASSVKGS